MSKTIKSVLVALIAVVATMSAAPVAQATGEGFEGCTPGYWKNHTDNWEEASPGEIFGDRFDDAVGAASDAAGWAGDRLSDAADFGKDAVDTLSFGLL